MALTSIMPPPGVSRGATADTRPGRWFDMNLMRFRGGQLQPIGGSAAIDGAVGDGTPPRDVITWHTNLHGRWAAFGTDNKLYAFSFDTHAKYDITPAGVGSLEEPGALVGYGLADYGEDTYGTARRTEDIGPTDPSGLMGDWWSLALFGEDLMFVPSQEGSLYRWSPNTPTTAPVKNATAPESNRGVMVTDERHVVLIGAGGNMRAVAWCSQENDTDWTPTVSNTAGSLMLETEGRPLRAQRAMSANLIFTDNDVHLMTYRGPPYVYGINRVGENCGLISPRSVSIAGQKVIWMGVQGFFEFSGTVQPLACDVHDWMFSLLNRQMVGRVFGFGNPTFREHWYCWPSEDATECNRYVAVNYAEAGTPWIIGRLARTAADTTGAMIRPILGTPEGTLHMHEFGWTSDGESRVGQIYAETGTLVLGAGDTRFHVTQIETDFAGPPQIAGYRFFCRERSQAAETNVGPYPIITTNGLTDARFSSRRARMRIEALQDGPWALGVTKLDMKKGGLR
jgi:hypothetical protein